MLCRRSTHGNPLLTSITFVGMYVFDTSLEPNSSLHGDARFQRLIFRLPADVIKTAMRDHRRMLRGVESNGAVPPPWDAEGTVCFSYSGETGISTPVFADRRDVPLGGSGLQRIRPGCRVRLTVRQVRRRQPRPGTRLQVLKVQVLHLDAPHQGGPASPHSIQNVNLQLPLDLMQEVERLALCEDWSTQAWLRNAIEAHVRQTRVRLGLDETAA